MEVLSIGDVCEFSRGLTYKKSDEVPVSSNAVLRANNVTLETGLINFDDVKYISDEIDIPESKKVKKGSLLICTASGSKKHLGKIGRVESDIDFAYGGFMGMLTPKDNIDSKYLYWLTQSKAYFDFIQGLTDGANINNLKFSQLKDFPVPVFSLEDQKSIVAILDQAFADIEQARANTEQNLKNARELFESYLQQVFSQRGEGWVEKKIGDLTALITKGSSPKWQGINYVEEPGVLFVTSENVGVNQMIYKKNKYVEEAFNTKGPKSILSKGDVLTNIVGASIGRTAIFDRDDVANINQAVCLMRCNSEVLYNEYLAYLLNSPYLVKVLHDNEVDNARANLSLGFFRNLGIPLPTVEAQKILVEQIKAMHLKTDNLEVIYQRKLDSLDELKKSILQKAFSGELTKTLKDEANKGAVA